MNLLKQFPLLHVFLVLVRVNSNSLNKCFCMCTFRSPQTILSLNASFKNALSSQYLESLLSCTTYSLTLFGHVNKNDISLQ